MVAEKPNEGEERGEGVSGWRDEKGWKTCVGVLQQVFEDAESR